MVDPRVKAALDLFELTERKAAALLLEHCHEYFNRRLLLDAGSDDDLRDSALFMFDLFNRHAKVIFWLLSESDHQPKLKEVPWIAACLNAGSFITADKLHDDHPAVQIYRGDTECD
jgi:hypothetical protein